MGSRWRRAYGSARAGLLACCLAGSSPAAANAFSLLAVGDQGGPPHWLTAASGQYAVGTALEEVDERRPVDALLLLGDNFYASGLRRNELIERVRGNVVAPYCRFVDLSGPRSSEVRSACDRP